MIQIPASRGPNPGYESFRNTATYTTVASYAVYSSQNSEGRDVNNSEEQERRDKLASSPIRLLQKAVKLIVCKKTCPGSQDYEHRESEYDISTGNKTQIEHIYQQTVFVHIEYMRHAHQIHSGRAYLKTHPTCASRFLQSVSLPPRPKMGHNPPNPATSRRLPSQLHQSHRQQSRPLNRGSPKVYTITPRADRFKWGECGTFNFGGWHIF